MATDWRNYAADDLREQVRGQYAFMFQSEFNPQTGMKSITRGWRVSGAPVEQIRDFLFTYGDGDQLTPTTEITDPAAADGIRQQGTWKITKIFELSEHPGDIYETLVSQIDGRELELMAQNNCACKVTRTYHWDAVEVETVPEGSSGVTYAVENVTMDRETGLFSYVLEKRETLTLKLGAWTSEIDSSQQTDSTIWKGVREGDVDDAGQPLAGLDDMSRETWKIKRENRTKNDDCTHDIRQDITEVEDQTGGAAEDSAARASSTVTHTQGDNLGTAVDAATGTLRRTSSRPTEAGRYATSDETVTAKDQIGHESDDRASQKSETTIHTQNGADIGNSAVAGPGWIQRKSSRPTEFGLFATSDETITAKLQRTEIVSEDRADQVSRTITTTHDLTEAEAATHSRGMISRATSREDEFACFSNVEEVTSGKPQEKMISWTDDDGDHHIYLWWRNQQPGYGQSRASQYGAEYRVSVSVSENSFGLEDGTLSGNDKDTGDDRAELKWFNVGWVSWPMSEKRYTTTTEKVDAKTVPVLWEATFEWTEYSITVGSYAEAENANPPETASRRSIKTVQSAGRRVRYVAEFATTPTAKGQWTRV